MKLMAARLTVAMIVPIIFCAVLSFRAAAQATEVDWKLYGWSDNDQHCFYDASTAERHADRHVRVWAKCLLQSEMDAVDIEKDFDGKIVNGAAHKVVSRYVPPIADFVKLSADEQIAVIRYEVTADIGSIEPAARIFYELNCSERMMRELSIQVRGRGSHNKPLDWKFVAPETNGTRLLKMLCPEG
ncbi:hypothetical protein [Bradyrhizobium mercantei]|uniref:hypothetical protein n=1 Tax=Bradyrhizobium mercantei TaxID=1904807 RepID=UPI0009780995|nr:hypothetical protein [Bradyrhizobium mercantei]